MRAVEDSNPWNLSVRLISNQVQSARLCQPPKLRSTRALSGIPSSLRDSQGKAVPFGKVSLWTPELNRQSRSVSFTARFPTPIGEAHNSERADVTDAGAVDPLTGCASRALVVATGLAARRG